MLKDKIFDSIKNEDDPPPFSPNNAHLSFPQTAEEAGNKRKIENKEYIQTQLKIRTRDFKTAQNIEREQQQKLLRLTKTSFACWLTNKQ